MLPAVFNQKKRKTHWDDKKQQHDNAYCLSKIQLVVWKSSFSLFACLMYFLFAWGRKSFVDLLKGIAWEARRWICWKLTAVYRKTKYEYIRSTDLFKLVDPIRFEENSFSNQLEFNWECANDFKNDLSRA